MPNLHTANRHNLAVLRRAAQAKAAAKVIKPATAKVSKVRHTAKA